MTIKSFRLGIAMTMTFMASTILAAPVAVQTSTLDKSLRSDKLYGIGFTSSVAQRPFVGVDAQDTTLIYLKFRYANFYIEGLDVGYKLYEGKDAALELLATPRFYEVEPAFADNGELDGIDITRQTYFAGLSGQYHTQPATFTVQYLTDILESDGSEILLTASKAFPLGATFKIAPTIGITYQDAKLVDHFYGVQAHETRPGRPAYGGHSSTNYHVSLTGVWDTSDHFRFLGQVKYEVLGSGITNSPIIDKDAITTVVVGVVYQF